MSLNSFAPKVCLFVCLLYLSACQPSTPGNLPVVDVWDLMLSETSIPTGWELLERNDRPIVSFGEEEAASLDFYYLRNPTRLTRGGVTLYRHDTVQRAVRQYETQVDARFDEDGHHSYDAPLSIPDGFTFKSSFADEWQFGCAGYSMGAPFEDAIMCVYVVRYGQYIAFFSIATTYQEEQTIDIVGIQELIEVIDNNMETYLQP